MSAATIRVVAGVVSDDSNRVLVAQRPAGKHLAGYWEFPGGKIDPGESPLDALRRELHEEIGIEVRSATPLITVPWTYPEKRIVLEVWRVGAYEGVAHSREAQALQWITIEEMRQLPMPPADAPIIAALRLPERYLITPKLTFDERAALLEGIDHACRSGIRLIQFREPTWTHDEIVATVRDAHEICARFGTALLLNADWKTASLFGLEGVHLPARIASALDARPVPSTQWLGVSCHDTAELAHAARIGADFATLAPVAATPSHPAARPLGWSRFAALVADAPLPVYALGGLGATDADIARERGGHGIAAIRAFWP